SFPTRRSSDLRSVGIAEATTSEVFVHGPDVRRILLSVETSTPQARALTEALMNAGTLASTGFPPTSSEGRAIVSDAPVETVTKPMSETVSRCRSGLVATQPC